MLEINSKCSIFVVWYGQLYILGRPSDSSNPHINILLTQVYHCLVRYRQLHMLHLQLRREFPGPTLPVFPPKKLFTLTEGQVIICTTLVYFIVRFKQLSISVPHCGLQYRRLICGTK